MFILFAIYACNLYTHSYGMVEVQISLSATVKMCRTSKGQSYFLNYFYLFIETMLVFRLIYFILFQYFVSGPIGPVYWEVKDCIYLFILFLF